MKIAVLMYRPTEGDFEAQLAWVDPFSGQVLKLLSVAFSPNLGVFLQQDCVLISYGEYGPNSLARDWLDVYRLSDWSLLGHLPMDCRAHFNVTPSWSTFVPGPGPDCIYLYKSRSLGNHLAEDFICALDLDRLEFSPWNFRVPECVAGWSPAGRRAQAQMLFVSDGLEVGALPSKDLDQKVAFWLGPEKGMGPTVSIGPRPRAHGDLGHARAILFAPERPLSVIVCTDGTAHLIDPLNFRYLERQKVPLGDGHGMPIFAAQIDAKGRFLYVGAARDGARSYGLTQQVVVHDLVRGCRHSEWVLSEPFRHMALTEDGRHLCGASSQADQLWVLDAITGSTEAVMPLDGSPVYVIPVGDAPS